MRTWEKEVGSHESWRIPVIWFHKHTLRDSESGEEAEAVTDDLDRQEEETS